MDYFNLKVILTLIICSCVASTPVVIKSAVSKNQGDEENQKVFNADSQQGVANFEAEAGFNKDNEQKQVTALDSGRYGEQSGANKNSVDQGNYNQNNFQQNDGGHVEDLAKKGARKKGHHKSGFHNSYYKDETGSNSSFFDDGEDQNDEYLRRHNAGAYGDAAQQQQNKGHLDNAQYAQGQAKHGQYDNAGRFQKDQGDQRNYDRRGYYDNRQNAADRGSASNYGGGERYAEEQYANRPPFVPIPPPYPERALPSPRRITIYEDPRYVDARPGLIPPRRPILPPRHPGPRYGDDYVQLDVRRPDYGYYDNRPLPPDYYY